MAKSPSLNALWKVLKTSKKLEHRIIKAVIYPIIYGCEIWALKQQN